MKLTLRLSPRTFFRGLPVVARQEFLANLKSIRLIIMVLVLALAVVGGSYGLSGGPGGPNVAPLVVWAHPAWAPNGSHVAAVFLSNAFGVPQGDRVVEFSDSVTIVGENRTDSRGFTQLPVGNRTSVAVTATTGRFVARGGIAFVPSPVNFTVATAAFDFNGDNVRNDVGLHVFDLAGEPVPARLSVDGAFVRTVDPRGFGPLDLPVGLSNVTVEVAGQSVTLPIRVEDSPFGALFGTPDATLYLLSAFFLYLIVPIFAIVVTFDAVSKERVQGTLDLLLSRPVSRTGVLLGKFVGSFAAVAFPVTLVNAIGVLVITATSGQSPTGGFVGAFLVLTLMLAAFYVLLQLIFSTLAKTSGTAVLFGVLVWLLFNLLFNILVFVVGGAIGDPAARSQFQTFAGLGNPSSIYQQLVGLYAPEGLGFLVGGVVLDAGILVAAAIVWLAALLIVALWVFDRKAAA